MQGGWENHLPFMQITMCDQGQAMTSELRKGEDMGKGEESIHQIRARGSSGPSGYRRECLKLIFHQRGLMIVGALRHRCGYPASLAKPFSAWGKYTGYEFSVTDHLSQFAWDPGVSQELGKPGKSWPQKSLWVLAQILRLRDKTYRLFWGQDGACNQDSAT